MRNWIALPLSRMAIVLAVASAVSAARTDAVEIRHPPPDAVVFSADMRRAYTPCVSPNTVAANGIPACEPAVTSACVFSSFTLQVTRFGVVDVKLRRKISPNHPEICNTGTYVLHLTSRTTSDPGHDELCGSDVCTFPDDVLTVGFQPNNGVSTIVQVGATRHVTEVLGATIVAPDGLPIAATGMGLTSPVNVAYPPCTEPDPGRPTCSVTPWRPACDFNSGKIEWYGTAVPAVRATLLTLAGVSPLCTTGTYLVEADVRATLANCHNVVDGEPCTLVDRTVSFPLAADGKDLITQSGLNAAGISGVVSGFEVRGTRVIDPTGALLAAPGVANADDLVKPRLVLSGGKLRLRATFPPPNTPPVNVNPIDPTGTEGARFTVTSHDGVVFSAFLPGPTWQLQPPIGERWTYSDPGGSIAGIRKVRIKLKHKKGVPIGYDVKLGAEGVVPAFDRIPSVNIVFEFARGLPQTEPGPRQAQRSRVCVTRADSSKLDCR
jgi:hypothetical protein